jgi:hypothetical protein
MLDQTGINLTKNLFHKTILLHILNSKECKALFNANGAPNPILIESRDFCQE